jgi:glycosyltransferase involved in cell wall biosynthesis
MRILIATAQTPFVRGGAEILADELQAALDRAGHTVDQMSVPFKWYPPQCVADHMAACRLLDVSEFNATRIDRVIGLKFPAYFVRHPDKVLWLVHQHREAYDLWDRRLGAMYHSPDGSSIRELVMQADTELLETEYSVRFTISENVSERLLRYNQIDSTALYHPPQDAGKFYSAEAEPYLFFPSRITPIKRQDLVIEAFAAMNATDLRLVLAGVPDSQDYLQQLLDLAKRHGVDERIEFTGYISDEEKTQLYSRCLAVVYPPLDEDYGYVTLEAMLSRKAVVTCDDSGGVLEFLRDGETGRVCVGEAGAMARALDEIVGDPARTAEMGRQARDLYDDMGIDWANVVRALTQ